MQDPERLLTRGTDFERALLRGGIAERPNARLVRRMALGAGVGGALSYTASAKALAQTWWGKTVAVAVVGGGVAAGVAGAMSGGTDSTLDRAPRAVVPAVPRGAEPPAPVPVATEVTAQDEARSAIEGDTTTPAATAAPNPRPRSRKPAGSLAEEVKQLDRVRASMARGDRVTALRELDRYAQRHPAGTLRREASVLRARATELP